MKLDKEDIQCFVICAVMILLQVVIVQAIV